MIPATYIARNPYIMKTSVSLTILGVYNALMGVMCLLMPGDMAVAAIGEANAANPELLEMATLFHYGIGHAISTCGLLLLMIRKCALDTAKNALLAYSIGTALLLTLFASVFSESPVMDFRKHRALTLWLLQGQVIFAPRAYIAAVAAPAAAMNTMFTTTS